MMEKTMSAESVDQVPTGTGFKMGRVVVSTLSALFKQALVLFPATLGFVVFTQAVGFAGIFGLEPAELITSPRYWIFLIVGLLVGFVFQAYVVHVVVEGQRGKKPTIGASFQAALKSLFPLIVTGVIVLVCCYIGLFLLVVPGVMLFVMWSVAVPVIIVERVGPFKALGRSRTLTKGSRWHIFGLSVIAVGLAAIMTMAIYGFDFQAMSVAAQSQDLTRMAITGLVSWISYTLFYAGLASIYSELRLIKEGVPKTELAAAFE
jgi:hypothetical protein